jgi:hypothetical protein
LNIFAILGCSSCGIFKHMNRKNRAQKCASSTRIETLLVHHDRSMIGTLMYGLPAYKP